MDLSRYINEVCFEKGRDIPNTREKSRKSQSVTECGNVECGKLGVIHTNVEYLSYGEVEALTDAFNYWI